MTVGDLLADRAIKPALNGGLALLELVDEWAMELNDPQRVVELARSRGLDVSAVSDLASHDLRNCDGLLARHALSWRSLGALEGAGMGALGLVPMAGLPLSITADVIVLQIMSTSIATRVAYSYGFDANAPEEREFIMELVTRALGNQLGKAAPLNSASLARADAAGRVRWSQKLRDDHVLIERLEQLMAKWYPKGKVPVAHMSKALSVFAIVVGAGINAHTLGRVAKHSQKWCQTRFLAEKYGLELPAAFGASSTFDASGDKTDGAHEV